MCLKACNAAPIRSSQTPAYMSNCQYILLTISLDVCHFQVASNSYCLYFDRVPVDERIFQGKTLALLMYAYIVVGHFHILSGHAQHRKKR